MEERRIKYVPDILDTIANISNDEVFTPPSLVNKVLDMLPQELFESSTTTFLDPCCKTGVFLREIVKRLDKGLREQIPNTEERIQHILTKQVYGISISHLCHLMTKRTLYCSKYANERLSLAEGLFDSEDGNIIFDDTLDHNWDKDDKCKICGMSKEVLKEKETKEKYAYWFIHKTIEEIKERFKSMKFDVIIANPPYQLEDGGQGASATPIYNLFVETALKLKPNFISMIIPSRWMVGGKGLDKFRESMIADRHIVYLHDFINSADCFSGVDIKGGVCYFLWDANKEGKCRIFTHNTNSTKESIRFLKEEDGEVFIRQPELIEIKNKVWFNTKQKSFKTIVSVQKPYGFRTDYFAPTIQEKVNGKEKKVCTTTEKKYGLATPSETPIKDGYEILGLLNNKRVWRYVPKDYNFPKRDGLGKYKIFIPNAYGCGTLGEVPSTPVLGTPVLGTPVQACTETFLELGPWETEEEAKNALKYLKTKFFRSLVSIMKQTQHTSTITYQYVPIQNFTSFSDIDWSETVDKISHQLYKKYNLTQEEIDFIEQNIQSME